MGVEFDRHEYNAHHDGWVMVSTLCSGEAAVKQAGEILLPNPCVAGSTGESRTEAAAVYSRYKDRALYVNVVGRTRSSLVSAVFRRSPKLTIPDALAYVTEDCDGTGVSIYQQSQAVLSEVMTTGRAGLLVDFPQTLGAASVADMQAGLIRANIVAYDATQIVNWQYSLVGGKSVLTTLVLAESVDAVEGFESKSVVQRRELALEDGLYVVRLWRKDEQDEWVIHGEAMPTTATGQRWAEIPFCFIGALNNNAAIDHAPMYDLACVNRKHYQLGADWYNALFYAGQPQPTISGLTEDWRDWLQSKGIVVGSRSPFLLPAGGAFTYATVPADIALQRELNDLEARMVSLGARLVMPGEAAKTATQSAGEQEVGHSIVSLAAENVSDAYSRALQYAQAFMGGSGECEYRLNGDIAQQSWDAQTITALISAWQSGTMPKGDVQKFLQKVGLIDPKKTQEEIDDETSDAGMSIG